MWAYRLWVKRMRLPRLRVIGKVRVLKPGPPTNDYEIWLATALLGVTFPFLIFFAEFFKMWPLQKAK